MWWVEGVDMSWSWWVMRLNVWVWRGLVMGPGADKWVVVRFGSSVRRVPCLIPYRLSNSEMT